MTRKQRIAKIKKEIRKGITVYASALSYQGKKRLFTVVNSNDQDDYEKLEKRLVKLVLGGDR